MSAFQSVQDAVEAVKSQASPETEQPEAEAVEVEAVEQEPVIEVDDIQVEVEPEEIPSVEAPNSWSKEDKEHFSTLPHDTQARLAESDRKRTSDIRLAHDETAATRKELNTQTEAVNEQKAKLLERLNATGPKKPDVSMLEEDSENYDPDKYRLAEARFERGQTERQALEDEISLDSATKLAEWQRGEIKNYQQTLPEYVDPEKGQAYRQSLAEHAVSRGLMTMEQAIERFPTTSAAEMSVLADAMKWRNAVAKAKKKTVPKPKTLKAGNTNPVPKPKGDMKSAAAAFAKSRSPADAAALFRANKG